MANSERGEHHPATHAHTLALSRFTTTPWSDDGRASLEATGGDVRLALEAGLRAVLALAVGPGHGLEADVAKRVAPIHGEGADLSALFVDLAEDFLQQVEDFGASVHDVALDGVLHRDGGGFVAWGYATGPLKPAPRIEAPRLLEPPTVISDDTAKVILRAALRRA